MVGPGALVRVRVKGAGRRELVAVRDQARDGESTCRSRARNRSGEPRSVRGAALDCRTLELAPPYREDEAAVAGVCLIVVGAAIDVGARRRSRFALELTIAVRSRVRSKDRARRARI